MDRKKIIQIVIIAISFGGSGLVLYNGFFKKPPTPVPIAAQSGGEATVAVSGPLLPYGKELNFGHMTSGRFLFDAVRFASVNTSTEVGVPLSGVIRTLSEGE